MAHEMGHSIADDYQRQAGNSYRDNPEHINEMQAYLTQNILWDYLRKHPDQAIADAAEKHFSSTMKMAIQNLPSRSDINDRPVGLLTVLGLYNRVRDENLDMRRKVSETLFGNYGTKNINQVLFVAGVKDQNDLDALAKDAVKASLPNEGDTALVQKQNHFLPK
jgi:hypothetical protein